MKRQKFFAFAVAMVMAASIQAQAFAEDRVEVDGGIIMESDENLLFAEFKILVPPKGEGAVSLKSGDTLIDAEKFFVHKENGKTTFVAVFPASQKSKLKLVDDEEQETAEGSSQKIVFVGPYQRGKNAVRYSGDVFVTDAAEDKAIKGLFLEGKKYDHQVFFAGTFQFMKALQ